MLTELEKYLELLQYGAIAAIVGLVAIVVVGVLILNELSTIRRQNNALRDLIRTMRKENNNDRQTQS